MATKGAARGGARWLPAPLVGVLTFVLMLFALLLVVIPLFLPVAILKVLIPIPVWQRWMTSILVWIAGVPWIGSNRLIFTCLHGRRGNVEIDGVLDSRRSWLLVSNHQSWADILLLFDVCWLRVPFPRFFLKRELIWVPLIGLICWALDMPFMKRQRQASLSAQDGGRNQDLETTRRFCEKYRSQPITVVNFLEGTRFTLAKRDARGGDFRHLLRPKSAGLSFTLNAMGEQFAGMIDVTIVYAPSQRSSLWSFLCGEQHDATVRLRVREIPVDELTGDYAIDREFRARFQDWVNRLWAQKDAELDRMRRHVGQPAAAECRYDQAINR